MEKRNYEAEMTAVIKANEGRLPKLLLQSCCGPCSSSVIEYLVQFFDLTILWYNPNLYPESEYDLRLDAQLKVIQRMGLENRVKIITLPWRSEDYYSRIGGLEDAPEGGARCAVCFRIRLEEAARIAKEQGFDYFCSTLTLSRHKNHVLINAIGGEISAAEGIAWLPSEFKKKGREQRSQVLCAELDIYRQDYCGCEFSLLARQRLKEAAAIKTTQNA